MNGRRYLFVPWTTLLMVLLSSCKGNGGGTENCENIEVFQRQSPSVQLTAVFYERRCGKGLSTYHASILPTSSPLKNEPGNTLIIENGWASQATWDSDNELTIHYFGKTQKTERNVGGVQVIFYDDTAK